MVSPPAQRTHYRFADFTLSKSRRVLSRSGREVPLIPRYFDLLVLLIDRRGEAIHRREILDLVWSDVVVSDGALTQAVRSLRRALGDDSRDPAFIGTVSRHGYRFIFPDVIEAPDDSLAHLEASPRVAETQQDGEDPFEAALDRLLGAGGSGADDVGRRREAAEMLHALGTAEALRRLDLRPGGAVARALLRDARWDVPDAGPVPIIGSPGTLVTIWNLVALRSRRLLRLAGRRWIAAVCGGALAGLLAGLLGGLALLFGPGSDATTSVLVALPLVGLVGAGVGAVGVGAGLVGAEALIRSFRGPALVALGALGGGVVGTIVHLLGWLTLEGLFGGHLSPMAGGLEGVVIGGAAGVGYAIATPTVEGGMATPRGASRLRVAILTGVVCAAASAALSWSGSHLGAMSLHLMARSFPGSQVSMAPLAQILGETEPGVVTSTVIGAWEGLMFGIGLALGLTHRPR